MNFKKPLGFFSEKFKEPSVCESCGEEFICGATMKGCWCMNIKLTDKTLKELRSKFKKCLCQDCLKQYSSA